MTQELTKEIKTSQQQNSIDLMIDKAIDKGIDISVLEKLLAMRKELKADFAKEEFDKAMSVFQGECPIVEKKKEGSRTNSGQLAFKYAPLEDIIEAVKPLLAKNGFSYLIETEFVDHTGVITTCIVKHSAGHQEKSSMKVPLGIKTQLMSAPQVSAAAASFSKRYAFINAFGIVVKDEDNENNLGKTIDLTEAQEKIKKATTYQGLTKIWQGLSKEEKASKELITFASELRKTLNK